MRARSLLLLVLAVPVLSGATPAHANDAQLRYEAKRYAAALTFLLKRATHKQTVRAFATFAARCARMARRAGRRISHIAPSTVRGAHLRHRFVAAFREARIGCRLILLGANARSRGLKVNLIAAGAKRFFVALFATVPVSAQL